jgi:hypothetical protein
MLKARKRLILFNLVLLTVLVGGFFVSQSVQAQDFGTGYLGASTLPTDDIRLVVIRIINIVLGVIGVVFVLLVIYAGYLWMTAGGNTDRVTKAKKILINAVTGLIIIFMAFAITTFIFNILEGTSNSGGSNQCTDGEVSGCSVCVGGSWQYDPALCPLPGSEFRINTIETANGSGSDDADVYLCSSVQATTNNNIDAATVPGNVTLTSGGGLVAATLSISTRAVEMIPDSELAPNTTYTAHYDTAMTDTSGLALSACAPFGCSLSGSEYVWNFTTGTQNDADAPFINSSNPTSDFSSSSYPDRNVDRDEIITVNFSEAVRTATIDDGTGSPVAGNIILQQLDGQGGSPVLTIDPSLLEVIPRSNGFDLRWRAPNLYEPFTWYSITVQNIEDLCGNPMDSPLVWEFQTNDTVPGVASWYPTGSNICPDVGVVTVSFNTSMYYDQVSITIAGGSTLLAAGLRASDLAPGPYQVSVAGGTWSVDPASDFKVFTFSLDSSLALNTSYLVNVTTDRVIDSDLNALGYSWSFDVSDSASCSCAPYISAINPDQGFLGQCVTITGACFNGAEPDDTADPRYATITALTFDSVPAIIGGQGENYVTTSVPGGFIVGDTPLPQVTITYNDTNFGSLTTSNTSIDYFVESTEQASGPCLLELDPDNACFDDSISYEGLRFGTDPGVGSRSTASDNVTLADGLIQIPDVQVSSWSDTRINASVPVGTTDGNAAVTASGALSNSVPFDLACGAGSACSSNSSSCVPESSICDAGLFCNDSCICESITEPEAPVVTEREPTCSLTCTNADFWAVFSEAMDATTIDGRTDNVQVQPCTTDCSAANLGAALSLDLISYDAPLNQVNISTTGDLAVSTSYRVLLFPGIMSSSGLALGGLNFDSAGSGSNDSYSWTFTTKDSACELSGVTITPLTASATSIGQTLGYNSYAEGSNQECGNQVIDRNSLDWTWDSSNAVVASITNNLGLDTLVDPIQTATALTEGSTDITATSGSFSAAGTLTVDVITCDETTDCTDGGLCSGSVCDLTTNTCTPVINSLSPSSGPVSRWVTVAGCYFGASQGTGSVDFDTTPALFPACGGGSWLNDQIIVEVPTLSTGSYAVAVTTNQSLVSNAITFTVTDDCSGVSVPVTGIPGICNLRPDSGAINSTVDVEGVRFGVTNDTASDNVTYANTSGGRSLATVNSWSDVEVVTIVPTDAATGDVIVEVDACPSNGVEYTVDIGPGTDCSSDTDQCVVDDNLCGQNTGLFCDPDNACTCQLALAPQVISVDPAGGEIDVCRNQLIEVTFDQLMNNSSLGSSVILERDNGATVCSVAQKLKIKNLESRIGKLLNPILNYLNKFIQLFTQSVNAQGPNWCQVGGVILSFDEDFNDDGQLTNLEDRTIAQIDPFSILDASEQYRVRVLTSAQSRYGTNLATEYVQSSFTTGVAICQISRVEVIVTPPGLVQTSDIFFCAGSDDCEGDQDLGQTDNQHRWLATAYDSSVPANALTADYHWTEVDTEDVYVDLTDTEINDIFITPRPFNGTAVFSVGASDNTGLNAGSATSTLITQNILCDNPWPARPNFPFIDADTDFSTWYCRDQGVAKVCFDTSDNPTSTECSSSSDCLTGERCKLDPSDDLPELSVVESLAPGGGITKEFLFLLPAPSTDAVAVRVYDNEEFLSPTVWYNRNTPSSGSPQSIEINGYQGIKDGRTIYVSAALQASGSAYTSNIYVMSYNKNATAEALTIYNELLDNWRFTINLTDLNVCSSDASVYCESDNICQALSIGTCEIDAVKIRRDTKRVTDLGGLRSDLERYRGICSNDNERGCVSDPDCLSGGSCLVQNDTYPLLPAGTFILGQSTSKWPSWNETLGSALEASLPPDPVNEFASCPVGYDQEACWDDTNNIFECSDGSHIYQYQVSGAGSSYSLLANMEMDSVSWQGFPGSNSGNDSCTSYSVGP